MVLKFPTCHAHFYVLNSKLNKWLQTSVKESCQIPNFCSENFHLTQNLSAYTHWIACGLPAAEEEEADHVFMVPDADVPEAADLDGVEYNGAGNEYDCMR